MKRNYFLAAIIFAVIAAIFICRVSTVDDAIYYEDTSGVNSAGTLSAEKGSQTKAGETEADEVQQGTGQTGETEADEAQQGTGQAGETEADEAQWGTGQAGETGTSSGKDAEESYDFTVCFAGDINLDENWSTTQYMDSCANGIYDCISEELIELMRSADVMCLNNEFTYSTRGTPLDGKAYTFRADPKRVELLNLLGVDVVTLANNHVYDYGEDALLDTFDALASAGIPYFGAGRTLSEAMQPVYLEVDGRTIAFVAASRAEKYKMTPQATEDSPGILRCYDTDLFVQVIKEARNHADFVLAYVHWGTEYSDVLEDVQLATGREYLDAGADVVIGAHSHCLQGMEYYDGKPIIYSLGNYWFNSKTLDTMLLKLHFYGDREESHLEVAVVPALQSGNRTSYVSDPVRQRELYDYLESISVNVTIDDGGNVQEK